MKKVTRYGLIVFVLASMLLGACAAAPVTGASKVESASVAFTGTIDGISGSQWIVNGQSITVEPSVIRDGPFSVGDLVKVEVDVNQDGSITVTRVETPSSADLSDLPSLGDDNSNGNTNDDSANVNSNANTNDDNSNASNSNDDNSNVSNSNDDNSNVSNSNDDNSNVGNSNDDNSNASNSNDANSNDDNSNAGGSDDDNSNDDNSNGADNDNSGGGNDNGGNTNG
ncbi:MAG: hypothetical protein IPJ46_07085 [Anaerolineales bacterium]|nr:hypothetical protein [Anaerolineales bacterium]